MTNDLFSRGFCGSATSAYQIEGLAAGRRARQIWQRFAPHAAQDGERRHWRDVPVIIIAATARRRPDGTLAQRPIGSASPGAGPFLRNWRHQPGHDFLRSPSMPCSKRGSSRSPPFTARSAAADDRGGWLNPDIALVRRLWRGAVPKLDGRAAKWGTPTNPRGTDGATPAPRPAIRACSNPDRLRNLMLATARR